MTKKANPKSKLIYQLDQPQSAQFNMTADQALFDHHENNKSTDIILRFYTWSELAVSFGYRQDFSLVDQAKAKQLGISLVQRPTGGGLVLHQPGELTYALISPQHIWPSSIMASCQEISEIFVAALQKQTIPVELSSRLEPADRDEVCFLRPTKYELLLNGRKLMGSAQKRGRHSLLQQGSLQLKHLNEKFAELVDLKALQQSQIALSEAEIYYDYRELAQIIYEEFLTHV